MMQLFPVGCDLTRESVKDALLMLGELQTAFVLICTTESEAEAKAYAATENGNCGYDRVAVEIVPRGVFAEAHTWLAVRLPRAADVVVVR